MERIKINKLDKIIRTQIRITSSLRADAEKGETKFRTKGIETDLNF
jgi:hypothetical protein